MTGGQRPLAHEDWSHEDRRAALAWAHAHDDPDLLGGLAAPLTPRSLSTWLASQLKVAPGLAFIFGKNFRKTLLFALGLKDAN